MRPPRAALAGLLALSAATSSVARAPQESARQLQGEAGLVRAYDFILDARFDQADAELRRVCPPAPDEACDVLEATSLWWQILLDAESRALDPTFSAAVDRAIRTTTAWTEREPEHPESWFYLGGAYAARVQWRVLRNEKLSAARDGKQIKQGLEHAIELDPALDDAYFGVGMYKYYADVAPAAARFLRFLLLLPGGDKEEGLREMLRTRARGRLLQGEADYQLHIIYLWYERRTDRALELLQGLRDRYPGNPHFVAQIAEIQDTYLHDLTASLDTWRRLLALAREQRVNGAQLAEVQARLGIARILETLHQTDDAIEQLNRIVALQPAAPFGSLALAYLRLGEAHDRMGTRQAAIAAYRQAQAAAPVSDPHRVRTQAGDRLKRGPDPKRAEAYQLSLTGWRLLEHKDLPGAIAALERSVMAQPHDPVTRYRYGRALQARRDDAAALAQFELAIRSARTCPAPILGDAYLEAGRLHERAGHRDDALSAYRIASTLFGAGADTRASAARALERLETIKSDR